MVGMREGTVNEPSRREVPVPPESPSEEKRGWGPADAMMRRIMLPPFLMFLFISVLCPNGPVVCILGMQVIACDVTWPAD